MTNTCKRCKTCGKQLLLGNYVFVMLLKDFTAQFERYCTLDCLYEYERGQRNE